MGGTRKIVFVCLHGSGKSLIAAEHFRRLAVQLGQDVHATSAAADPDAQVPPKVMQGLLADGIDIRGYRPRRVTPEELAGASCVVSFGYDLGDLVPPGLTVERWDDVPEVRQDFRLARDAILVRLLALLAKSEGPSSTTPRP